MKHLAIRLVALCAAATLATAAQGADAVRNIAGAHPPHNSYAVVEISPDGDIAVKGFGDCESRVLQRGRECKG